MDVIRLYMLLTHAMCVVQHGCYTIKSCHLHVTYPYLSHTCHLPMPCVWYSMDVTPSNHVTYMSLTLTYHIHVTYPCHVCGTAWRLHHQIMSLTCHLPLLITYMSLTHAMCVVQHGGYTIKSCHLHVTYPYLSRTCHLPMPCVWYSMEVTPSNHVTYMSLTLTYHIHVTYPCHVCGTAWRLHHQIGTRQSDTPLSTNVNWIKETEVPPTYKIKSGKQNVFEKH